MQLVLRVATITMKAVHMCQIGHVFYQKGRLCCCMPLAKLLPVAKNSIGQKQA